MTQHSKPYYIGLMSGTSMDAVDAALVTFDQNQPQVIAYIEEPIPEALLAQLHQLCTPQHDDINQLGHIDRQMGALCASAALNVIKKSDILPEQISAIGSHGQTIRHMPQGPQGFTLQIGDPYTIAVMTGIDVVADFRRKDIALGGEGAPLVPAFHQALFAKKDHARWIVNIGGIANVTLLNGLDQVIGFDTGPGNTLMDAWIRHVQQKPFDQDGAFAKQGQVCIPLLEKMLKEPYFSASPPKSTGRELFHLSWLQQHLASFPAIKDADVQATLMALTVSSLSQSIQALTSSGEIFLCGGGAMNQELIKSIRSALSHMKIGLTDQLGLPAQQVEAVAFAWLAQQFLEKKTSNVPAVTGAKNKAILGALFPAQ